VISTTCGTRSTPYYFDSTPFNQCLAFYPRPATSSVFVRSSGALDNGDYRRSYVDPGYSGYFSRFTGSDFSGGQSTGTTDSETTTTFFPFWAPRAGFTSGYSSGRTVFETSGAMYGHFFDAPTSDDIGVWCSTFSSSSSSSSSSPPPVYCDLTWPSIDTGTIIGEVEFSRGMLSVGDLKSLRLSVDRDETAVVGVNGGSSGSSGSSRAVSFGGTMVDWYNALRNRWPGAASDWLDYYYWESVVGVVGELRSSSSSSSSSDPGTLNVLYGLMTGGGPGLPLRGGSSANSAVVQTFPDFVGGVILGSDGRTTTVASAAAAGFYSSVNRSGCSEYDGTDYCWSGCRGWRRAAGVPFWMWGRWCGDRTTTVR
jgi:hypothetical protein